MKDRPYKTLAEARARKLNIDFVAHPPARKPSMLGTKTFDNFSLETLVGRIDWTPFFAAFPASRPVPEPRLPEVIPVPSGRRRGQEAV